MVIAKLPLIYQLKLEEKGYASGPQVGRGFEKSVIVTAIGIEVEQGLEIKGS